jgi:RHS repeat-associated protein
MGVTNYHTVNGRMIGESGPSGNRRYLTDALGSVTATVKDGTVENTYRYKPYGAILAKTGTAPDPKFMWTGDIGSRRTSRKNSDQYNQARHYGTQQAQWTTVDPLWPEMDRYVYVGSNPVCAVDPSGLFGCSTVWRVYSVTCPKISFSWMIQWNVPLPRREPNDNGFIVQKITRKTTWNTCDFDRQQKTVTDIYWEAWEVAGQNIYNGYALSKRVGGRDEWGGGPADAQCQRIVDTMEGEACFFRGVKINWPVTNLPPAHLLPITRAEPPWWNKRKSCIKRSLAHTNICCSKSKCGCKADEENITNITTGC